MHKCSTNGRQKSKPNKFYMHARARARERELTENGRINNKNNNNLCPFSLLFLLRIFIKHYSSHNRTHQVLVTQP